MEQILPERPERFGFGFMRLPMLGEQVDIPQTKRMVDTFLDSGFCYFDTAHGYLNGQSELAIRECLTSRYPRERYILTNKLSNNFFSPARTSARCSGSSWRPAAWTILTFI